MVSRRTFETLIREHARREQQLLSIIAEQNDRIMYLAGRTWVPAPVEAAVTFDDILPPDDDDLELVTDGEQLIA